MTTTPNPSNVPTDIAKVQEDEKATQAAEAKEVADTATLAADETATPPVVPPPPAPDLIATAASSSVIAVSWPSTFVPVFLGRNGTDSQGTGPWSTTTIPPMGPLTFTFLLPSTLYTFTAKDANGVTITATAVTLAAATPPPPPPPNGAVVPFAPASLVAPTTVIFDDEMTSANPVWAHSWFGDGQVQNNTPMFSRNVHYEADGCHLTLAADGTGALISTNPDDGVHAGNPGLAVAPSPGKPVYVEYKASLPLTTGGTLADWPGLWLTGQSWPATGEIDVMEGFGGTTPMYHSIVTPPGGSFENPGGAGALIGGDGGMHTFGVLWEVNKQTFVYDGVVVGSEPIASADPKYLVCENSIGTPLVEPADVVVRDVRVWQ